ncbi:MAG: hypothetical protein M1826_002103 [Phylliscum demangeonii]|nr:MAG: hypothetical protein M1826_002103 [Phylliscum demangeonii]
MAPDPVYFELSWAILSTIGLINVVIGIIVIGITSLSGLSLLPVIVSGASAIANGLCYYAFYTTHATHRRVAASAVADLCWLIQEAGLSFYSYQILIRILPRQRRLLFMAVFWFIVVGLSVAKLMILGNRCLELAAGDNSRQRLISHLHIGYFVGIALVEAWSAFFLLRIFAAGHRNSETVFHRTNIFRELSRSTEVRVAALGLIGITRAVTYSFQTTAQSATSAAGQLDRFVTTLECMFPVIMMIDIISSNLSRVTTHHQGRAKASLTRPQFGRSSSGARALSSHTSLRSPHDVERHSFALLERQAAGAAGAGVGVGAAAGGGGRAGSTAGVGVGVAVDDKPIMPAAKVIENV